MVSDSCDIIAKRVHQPDISTAGCYCSKRFALNGIPVVNKNDVIALRDELFSDNIDTAVCQPLSIPLCTSLVKRITISFETGSVSSDTAGTDVAVFVGDGADVADSEGVVDALQATRLSNKNNDKTNVVTFFMLNSSFIITFLKHILE